jgi:hypothetical protein
LIKGTTHTHPVRPSVRASPKKREILRKRGCPRLFRPPPGRGPRPSTALGSCEISSRRARVNFAHLPRRPREKEAPARRLPRFLVPQVEMVGCKCGAEGGWSMPAPDRSSGSVWGWDRGGFVCFPPGGPPICNFPFWASQFPVWECGRFWSFSFCSFGLSDCNCASWDL